MTLMITCRAAFSDQKQTTIRCLNIMKQTSILNSKREISMQYVGDLSTIDLFVIFIFTLIIMRNKHRPTNYSKTGQLHFDKFYKNLNIIIPRFAIICFSYLPDVLQNIFAIEKNLISYNANEIHIRWPRMKDTHQILWKHYNQFKIKIEGFSYTYVLKCHSQSTDLTSHCGTRSPSYQCLALPFFANGKT